MAMKKRLRRFWVEWAKPLSIYIVLMCAVRSAVADWNDVPSGSMKPTILVGDRVVVNKLAYDLKVPFTTWHLAEWGNPERGDIVVFFSPADGKRLVKRVIGLPGDRLTLRDNHLLVNDVPVAYEPLELSDVNQIPKEDQSNHEFAAEALPGKRHAVMSTPALQARRTFEPVVIPEGHYFMMGDNRDNSFDSRYYGPVPRRDIVGRAVGVAFSLDHDTYYLPRGDRFVRKLK